MAILSLEIPDEFVPSALTYIPLYLKYQDEVVDEDPESPTYQELVPNPISKVARVKLELVEILKEMYKAGKVMAANVDLEQVRIDADTESSGITIVE